MVDADLPAFTGLLNTTMAVVSGGRYKPDGKQVGLWFALLRPYPLNAVTAALHAHLTTPLTARTLPIPADVIAQLHNDDGRPAVEEAWSIALLTRDEARTVVWTEEVAGAWGVARVVMPDKVGARMAFKDAYARLVGDARRAGRPVRWTATLGHDKTERAAALKAAAELGRDVQMPAAAEVLRLPPAPLLLLGSAAQPEDLSPAGVAAMRRMRELLAKCSKTNAAADSEARQRTADLKARSAAQVARYVCTKKGHHE